MRVGVLCEFSGVVRDAFLARGHDAISCDLLETECPGPHIKGDCLVQDWSGFDLLICHPPCTHLSVSGARYFAEKRADGRQQRAVEFFLEMTRIPAARIVIENPVGIMSSIYRRPDQIIQPWMFGHPESKATCLWLIGVEPLRPTRVLERRGRWQNQTPSGQNNLGPSSDRAAIRSKTYAGIAAAMAEQWDSSGLFFP